MFLVSTQVARKLCVVSNVLEYMQKFVNGFVNHRKVVSSLSIRKRWSCCVVLGKAFAFTSLKHLFFEESEFCDFRDEHICDVLPFCHLLYLLFLQNYSMDWLVLVLGCHKRCSWMQFLQTFQARPRKQKSEFNTFRHSHS